MLSESLLYSILVELTSELSLLVDGLQPVEVEVIKIILHILQVRGVL